MASFVRWIAVCSALVTLLAAADARAGGFEFAAPGTRALGRGGATYARADTPMVLLYNPAGLAELPGMQLMLDAHVAFFDACYTRESSRGAIFTDLATSGRDRSFSRFDPASMRDPAVNYAGESWSGTPLSAAPVCNEGAPGIVPELGFSWRLGPKLGLGVGLMAPAAVGASRWGDADGVVRAAGRDVPSPGRYVLVEQSSIIAFPSLGVGYRPIKQLRIGATFLWGLGAFDFTSYTVPFAGESPDADVRSHLVASDLFVPGAVVSVHAVPVDALDIVASFRWVSDVDAGGSTTLTHGWLGVGQEGVAVPSTVRTPLEISDTDLDVPQPWQLALGVRYAQRISPRPDDPAAIERLSRRVEDSMSNELWDLELDVVYELNSRLDDIVVTNPPATLDLRQTNEMGALVSTPLAVPTVITIPHGWKDQLSFRLGGDYNVIPGMAALRLGASFETAGVETGYENLDFMPFMRFGVHAGLTVRLGRIDISLAYAHLFQETREVSGAEARLPQVDATSGDVGVTPGPSGAYVNGGTYESNFDVLSLGVDWHI